MNQNDNKNNKYPADFGPLYKFCAILIAIAIVLFAFTYKKVQEPVFQIALFTLAGIILSFAIYLLKSVIKTNKFLSHKTNFFLYDKKLNGDKNIDSLTFSEARQKIQSYMSLFRRGKKLYLGDLFDERIKIPQVFRPLFCFELLYAITEHNDREARAKLFLSYGLECAGAFYVHLSFAGDTELADGVKAFFSDFAEGKKNENEFLDYLNSQKQHIEESVLKYLKEHINEF